ncbi:hypothetical protein QZH41_015175, partial [Actinostola sp. cb2023]
CPQYAIEALWHINKVYVCTCMFHPNKGSSNNGMRKFLFTTLSKNKTEKESKTHLLLLGIPLTAFGLGCWQVKRLYWKKGLIKELEERTTAEPLSMPDNIDDLDPSSLEYRRVWLKGRFDHSSEIHMMPRSLNVEDGSTGGLGRKPKSGAHIFTPFILSGSGKRILVNRGWVPLEKIQPEKRMQGQCISQQRPQFVPKNNIPMNRWHFRDVEAMAEITNSLPIQVDAVAGSSVPGGPIGGQTRVYLRNEHLQYIVTW